MLSECVGKRSIVIMYDVIIRYYLDNYFNMNKNQWITLSSSSSSYQLITVPLLSKGLFFSYREGMSIDRHAGSGRVGDFRLILIISPGFLTMFSFTAVSDVQDKLWKYICIEEDTLVLARIWTRNLVHDRRRVTLVHHDIHSVKLVWISVLKYNL